MVALVGSVFLELVTLARLRGAASNHLPKSVDLLFRALPKESTLSPPRETQDASAAQGDSHPSQFSPISAFGSSVVAGSTLNQESDHTLGVRDGCLSCGGVVLIMQVALVVRAAKEKIFTVARV